MRQMTWIIGLFLVLAAYPVRAITPEAARKELAQENIPYTVEAMMSQIEIGNIKVVSWFWKLGWMSMVETSSANPV